MALKHLDKPMEVKASWTSQMEMIYRLKINAHLEDHMQGSSSGVPNKVSGAMSKRAWIKRKRCEPSVWGRFTNQPWKWSFRICLDWWRISTDSFRKGNLQWRSPANGRWATRLWSSLAVENQEMLIRIDLNKCFPCLLNPSPSLIATKACLQ